MKGLLKAAASTLLPLATRPKRSGDTQRGSRALKASTYSAGVDTQSAWSASWLQRWRVGGERAGGHGSAAAGRQRAVGGGPVRAASGGGPHPTQRSVPRPFNAPTRTPGARLTSGRGTAGRAGQQPCTACRVPDPRSLPPVAFAMIVNYTTAMQTGYRRALTRSLRRPPLGPHQRRPPPAAAAGGRLQCVVP